MELFRVSKRAALMAVESDKRYQLEIQTDNAGRRVRADSPIDEGKVGLTVVSALPRRGGVAYLVRVPGPLWITGPGATACSRLARASGRAIPRQP